MAASKFFSFKMFKPKKPKSAPGSPRSPSGLSSPPPQAAPACDSVQLAHTLRIQDSADLRMVFAKLDANGDGKISSSELESMLHAFEETGVDAQSIMHAVDLDGDGYIQFDEFVSFIETAPGDEEQCLDDLRRAFAVYDRDGNGVITAEELRHVMRGVMGERTTLAECRRMIEAVDRNGDGAVSFDEFVVMMTHSVA